MQVHSSPKAADSHSGWAARSFHCSVGVGSLDVLRSGSAPVPIDAPVDVPPDDLRRDLAGAPVAPAPGWRSDYLCSGAASVDEVQAAASAADGRDDFAIAAPLPRRQ